MSEGGAEMILRKCEKGHYYNHDKFAECPYCALQHSEPEGKTQSWSVNSMEETETVIGRYGQDNGN